MGVLFDPRVEVHIYTGGRTLPTGEKYIISRDVDGEDLDVEFDIETFAAQGKKASPNTARISVYNLAEGTRKLLSYEHQAVEVYAGYGDSIGLIFLGETTNITHEHEDVDWRTDIYAADGIKSWETQYFNRSYKAGVLVSKVLADMASAIQLPYSIDTLDIDVLLKGQSFAGRAKDVLDEFTKDRGLEWHINHGIVEIMQKDSPFLRDPTVVIVNADTGMIGHPVLIERTNESPKEGKDEKRVVGVRVQSLMNFEIRPKRLVKVEASSTTSVIGQMADDRVFVNSANGVYIADVVRYRGDNFGGEFVTEFEGDMQ